VVRMGWAVLVTYAPRMLSPRLRRKHGWPSGRVAVFVGWAGLRGGDTLVTALAIPLTTASGAPFPFRGVILHIALGVILFTLVLVGASLKPLVKALGLGAAESPQLEEHDARRAAAKAGRDALLDAAAREGLDPAVVDRLS